MRKASEVENFPYYSKLICYILVYNNKVEQVIHYRKCDFYQVENAYNEVKNGNATLYAVWPGNYRSDLFLVDDVEKFAKELEIN